MGSNMVPNTGSTARDFCMLERNILSHFKLALLLSLMSSSFLLHVRLVPVEHESKGGVPLASVEFAAAMLAIVAGIWEYYSGYADLRQTRAFLAATKPHLILMSVVAGVVFGTCIVLVVQDQ
ncbi:hypothetical protein JR316_0008029 [Psilocybe cubensis]|uniref:DUF202 domain-containing protein n=2 Tax=Psilocybe cubensis TaxID=181762 RepID=A0A8H8CI83_PSICU|nr:hypothetical protein JR316_0008029 [Psilocybe cubensis]KAH9479435.1 hypothetical protein JR316_0008029 [Psilocybe cubensis]